MPVYTRTRHLRRALCPFFSACPTMATTLALVQVLAGSSGSHMGSGLENSRNVSQLLTALQSLPVTSLSCDCLQSSVKRSLVGGQSEDSRAPAVVLRSNPVCVAHRWKPVVTAISNQPLQSPLDWERHQQCSALWDFSMSGIALGSSQLSALLTLTWSWERTSGGERSPKMPKALGSILSASE